MLRDLPIGNGDGGLIGAALSVSPLAWSHAALVTLVEEYRRKRAQVPETGVPA